jgi:hypothetical protein
VGREVSAGRILELSGCGKNMTRQWQGEKSMEKKQTKQTSERRNREKGNKEKKEKLTQQKRKREK